MSSSSYLFPQEGMNYSLYIFPKGINSVPSNTFLGLFTTPWSTVESYSTPNVTLNGSVGGSSIINEVSFSGYSRIAINSGTWGPITSGTATVSGVVNVQQITATGTISWTASSTISGITGVFLATTSGTGVVTSGTGSGTNTPTVIWYAPFSDFSSVSLNAGDTIQFVPTWQSSPYAG